MSETEGGGGLDDDPTFTRQRRNLMLITFALASALFIPLHFDEVPILGAKTRFTDPTRVWIVGWLLWAYFLWRYWQVFDLAKVKEGYGEMWGLTLIDEAVRLLKKKHNVSYVTVKKWVVPDDTPANFPFERAWLVHHSFCNCFSSLSLPARCGA